MRKETAIQTKVDRRQQQQQLKISTEKWKGTEQTKLYVTWWASATF